jgi:tellurite resistance protein TerC
MTPEFWLWIGFAIFVIGMLALDLGVFHRKAHSVSFKEAVGWTVLWVFLASLFGLGVYHFEGYRKAVEFYTGYLIELSLSADNVFVFVLIFTYFAVPEKLQHKVLFWGVLGALVMRVVMIGLGASLIQRFGWLLYPFGAFLIFTGIKMIFSKEKKLHPEQNPLVRWITRRMPMTPDYREGSFFVRVGGARSATPLFVALVCVEVSDLIFAVDSIPAIFAVTLDPFIVYTSNVFAIMGLRSLYFVLARVIDKFYYLRTGLGVVLGFVGVKMLLVHTDHEIDTLVALGIVGAVLTISLIASVIRARFRSKTPSPKA